MAVSGFEFYTSLLFLSFTLTARKEVACGDLVNGSPGAVAPEPSFDGPFRSQLVQVQTVDCILYPC